MYQTYLSRSLVTSATAGAGLNVCYLLPAKFLINTTCTLMH